MFVFISHFIIDSLKAEYGKDKTLAYVVDQFLHLTVLIALWYFIFGKNGNPLLENLAKLYLTDTDIWLVMIAYILILQPTSIFLSLFIKKWTPTDIHDKSLPKAGKWIGYLEWVLILTFIFTSNVEGVGFLLAAKSIFRFGELNKSSEIKTTEYVLIGTFASFTIALLIGFSVEALLC